MHQAAVKVGTAERQLEVPLFAELYGFGPFAGRRNRGVRDPLYCRALSVNDGRRRNLMIVSDVCVMDDELARNARSDIAAELAMDPAGILFCGTHTHSAPALSIGIGWGERHEGFLQAWRETVRAAAREAAASEEKVTAVGGSAALSEPLGVNRVNPDWPTDTSIRWIRLIREDGSGKALIHNHGMHGVCFGRVRMASADWPGEVNRRIKERKWADTPFFFYGAAGDINPEKVAGGEEELDRIASAYIRDLECGLESGGRPLVLGPVQAALETFELPTHPSDAETMRRDAAKIREKAASSKYRATAEFMADRLMEMAILADRGATFPVHKDLQALRLGDVGIYAFPGEPFHAAGEKLASRAPDKLPLVVANANGNGRYFPTAETFDLFPEGIHSDYSGYGYYEIYNGCGRFMPPYDRSIAEFMVNSLLGLKPE